MSINKTLRGAVYGAAVGDALGVPFEFKRRDSFECLDMVGYGVHAQPVGTWSDDTALLLATCDSLRCKLGLIDIADIRAKFNNWLEFGDYAIGGVVFDVGNTTATAIDCGLGLDSIGSNGNGSLMRIIPLAFVDATDDEIKHVSAITHAHEISMNACVDLVTYARKLAYGGEIDPLDVPKEEIRSGGYVLETLQAAKWCLANTRNYKECVLAAVNLGGDTDTTACIAGALAGIIYGYDGIPIEWIKKLKGKDIIEHCIRWDD